MAVFGGFIPDVYAGMMDLKLGQLGPKLGKGLLDSLVLLVAFAGGR